MMLLHHWQRIDSSVLSCLIPLHTFGRCSLRTLSATPYTTDLYCLSFSTSKLSWTYWFDIVMSNLCWRVKCSGVWCCITVLSAPSVLKAQSFKTSAATYTERQCHIPENL